MTSQRNRRTRGMTLIEILVVLAAFTLMAGMIFVGFSASRSAEMNRSVNQIANTIRYGFDKARVTGEHFRLLIDFEKRSFALQRGDGRMYLPATDRDGKLIEFDPRKAEEQAERDRRAEESYNRSVQAQYYAANEGGGGGSGGAADDGLGNPYQAAPRKVPRRKPPLFSSFESENELSDLKKPIVLPESVKIVSVRTADDLQPITDGQASLYFFPRGQTQKAHILLADKEAENEFTIKVEPLTGRVTIAEGHEELELPSDATDKEDALGKRQNRRTF